MKISHTLLSVLLFLSSSLASAHQMTNIDKKAISRSCYEEFLLAAKIMTLRHEGITRKDLIVRLSTQGMVLNDRMNTIVSDAYTHEVYLDIDTIEEKKLDSERFGYMQRRVCFMGYY
mgnify:CR=1 FL=1